MRADYADRVGCAFCYDHPIVGSFVYHPNDCLSRRLFLYADFELTELRYAMSVAGIGGLVVDVGANIGLYSVALARASRGRSRVLALEPGPATFRKLQFTLGRLGVTNVIPLPIAAGSGWGRAMLLESLDGRDAHQRLGTQPTAANFRPVRVEVWPLDELCGAAVENVVLVKIDIEGQEINALNGARKILRNGRARLMVEVYPEGLAMAGGSAEALWYALNDTHECTAILCQDGSVRLPALEHLVASTRQETFNTFWLPRGLATKGWQPAA